MVDRIESAAGFERLREEWGGLLGSSRSCCLFLTWEWLYTWWTQLAGGRRLCLLVVRGDREAVAIAPLAVRPLQWTRPVPLRSLEFLGAGSVGSDYLDLIIRHGHEQRAVSALAEYLSRGTLMLELTQLNRAACLATELAQQLSNRGWSVQETATNVCPLITLSGQSWESYLTSLGREHRYNFRRRLKNLTQQFDVRFELVRSEEQRGEALALAIRLHHLRWQERGGSNAFHDPGLLSFHEEFSRLALKQGWLRLFVLRLDGRPAAALYGFRYGRTFYFYQSGFDPHYARYGVGLVTMGLAIKQAIEEGADEYDLLHGDEPYKFHWTRDKRELGRLEFYPPHARGWLCKGTVGFSRAARTVARQVLARTIADGIGARRQQREIRNDAAQPH